MKDCIFCKIAKHQAKADIVFENEQIIAFKDVNPLAPVHILIIPKQHITDLTQAKEKDTNLLGKMIMAAKNIAQENGTDKGGYKLLFRVKKHGGQEVDHIHLHLIGGAPLYEEIRPLKGGGERRG